eukprot:scaffold228010_cov45-Tisochrysis_lutea.AAC.1
MGHSLERLELGWNHIGKDAMKAFAQMLSKGALHHLTHLDLSSNHMDNEGIRAVADALSTGATLKRNQTGGHLFTLFVVSKAMN